MAEIIEDADQIIKEKVTEIAETIAPETVIEKTYPEFTEANVTKAFANFSGKFSISTATLIKMYPPILGDNEVSIKMHKANINLLEPIKVEWQVFLKDYFGNRQLILTIIEDDEIIKNTKAYTSREQLEELASENPLVKELVKKLNLKLK